MHPQTDLSLLLESLTHLSRSPYFNRALDEHTRALIDVVEHVLTATPRYDDEIVRQLVDKIWTTHRYLQGSTTKESPYEIEFCLRAAIREWIPAECLVTTALTDEKDFHLKVGDPWEFVQTTLSNYDKPLPASRLIFIGVPRLYKSMPLFCCALYHELGHFVDMIGGLTKTTLLLHPIPSEHSHLEDIMTSYRQEHFADLFAACYVGSATRSSYTRLGIALKTLVQPGYRGCLSVELFNHGNNPVELIVGAKMFQMRLTKLPGPLPYGGVERKYFGNVRPTPSRAPEDVDLPRLLNIGASQ